MSKGNLNKDLGLLEVFSISSGAMISSGLFILPGIAYVKAGPGMLFSYLIAGILAMTGILSQAELVSAMPKAGGDYFYIMRSMGPAAGTINGIIVWFSISLKTAFALLGMAVVSNMLYEFNLSVTAGIFCAVFVIINMIGTKEAGRIQVYIVAVLFFLLLVYTFYGIPHIDIMNLTPFTPYGYSSVVSTAGLVFVSYGGLLKLSSVAEETINPARNIPLGMITSLIAVGVLYAIVIYVTVGILGTGLGTTVENASLSPLTDGAIATMGKTGKIAISIAAVLAFISTANAGIMSASRYLLALSRDKLLPSFLGTLGKRSGVPTISILATGLFIIISVFIDLTLLIKTASTVMIGTCILSSVAVIVLRESKLQNYRPKFISPLYPWVHVSGIIGFSFLLYEMGIEAILTTLLLCFFGFIVYWFFGKKNADQEYAILHLIERITTKEFVTYELENELKDIIRERDQIVKDRFDHIIDKCTIVNISERIELPELFRIVAFHISNKLGIDTEKTRLLLTQRELDNSTAISDTIAIPHIIIEGEKIFDIFLFRTKKGVSFSPEHKDIKAIFVLVGTRDERNFHLRAISAIAQIVSDPVFEGKWTSARNTENLRDAVLLGRRKRII
jgi:basic amino acid/polyamine antiporter, APA family